MTSPWLAKGLQALCVAWLLFHVCASITHAEPSTPAAPDEAARLVAPEAAVAVTPPAPTLRPWYVSRRLELFGLSALMLGLLVMDLLRTGSTDKPGSRARKVRITLLGVVLFAAIIWGVDTLERRNVRRAWRRPLHVAVILLAEAEIDASVCDAFLAGAPAATDFLWRERRRYGPRERRPFWLHTFGPLLHRGGPPTPPRDDGILSRASYHLELSSYLSGLDDKANVESARYDVRLYVFAKAPSSRRGPRFVEGFAEDRGELGIVRVDLDATMLGTAWSATLHELMHTVGAHDKYDERGRARVPEGLFEPDKQPRYPQERAEIMSGDIPLSETDYRLPTDLDEVGVGAYTAREIGWLP